MKPLPVADSALLAKNRAFFGVPHFVVVGDVNVLHRVPGTVPAVQLETAAAQQAKEVQDLHAAFKTQAAQIEKISAQLETSRPGSGGGRQQVAMSSDSAEGICIARPRPCVRLLCKPESARHHADSLRRQELRSICQVMRGTSSVASAKLRQKSERQSYECIISRNPSSGVLYFARLGGSPSLRDRMFDDHRYFTGALSS